MSKLADRALIDGAFNYDTFLKKRVFDAIDQTPQHTRLFEDIAKYHQTHRHKSALPEVVFGMDEPTSKKRKTENGALPLRSPGVAQPGELAFQAKDISFSIPQRKKLHLELCKAVSGPDYLLGGRSPSTNEIEFYYVLSAYSHVLRLPVPEKAQKQLNFCILPSTGLLPGEAASVSEPIIFTVNDGPTKGFAAPDPFLAGLEHGSESVLEQALGYVMGEHKVKITYPEESEFASAVPESHRKSEKAYHVKAFRGSKDGYLFFLKDGIFFGFKKPLLFFPFDAVESTSYTSVLQRTFNLNIAYKLSPDSEPQEIEFSMIDVADHGGIDTYLKKHQLQDASMAEARRAKKIKVNSAKKDDADDGDDRTELQKAEQEMEDEEDEEDEDFEASGDDSDGSGASSEEEEKEYEVAGDLERNLVEEELGSEAEEVEPDENDDDQL